jgi:hypothetical protein
MRIRILAVVALLLIPTVSAIDAAVLYRATMDGTIEGNPEGSGTALFIVDGTRVNFTLGWRDIGHPISAHIHRGNEEVIGGPIVVDLGTAFGRGSASGSVVASLSILDEIAADPSAFYVNVHTQAFQGGAIRGQLEQVDVATGVLSLTLTGAAEVPGPGHPTGTGTAQLEFRNGALDYDLNTQGIGTPTAAHIHRGTLLDEGPPVVNLLPSFQNGRATGTVPVSNAMRDEILANPENFYVNVHTPEFPAGALRAQLGDQWILPIVGKALGANQQNFVTDLRMLNASGSAATVRIDFYPSSLSGLAGPADSRTVAIPSESMIILNDVLGHLFGISGLGAMTFTTSSNVRIVSRIINDLRDEGLGTNGLFMEARPLSDIAIGGHLPFLSNASQEEITQRIGFRTNLGFFNPTDRPVSLVLSIQRASDGAFIATTPIPVGPFQHLQRPIFEYVRDVDEEDRTQEDFFASWSSAGALFVYASVTDNSTGNAMVLH